MYLAWKSSREERIIPPFSWENGRGSVDTEPCVCRHKSILFQLELKTSIGYRADRKAWLHKSKGIWRHDSLRTSSTSILEFVYIISWDDLKVIFISIIIFYFQRAKTDWCQIWRDRRLVIALLTRTRLEMRTIHSLITTGSPPFSQHFLRSRITGRLKAVTRFDFEWIFFTISGRTRRIIFTGRLNAGTRFPVIVKSRDIERTTARATTWTIPRGVWQTRDTADCCRRITGTVRNDLKIFQLFSFHEIRLDSGKEG